MSSSPHAPSTPPFWLWPHILSLEAPMVAVAWTWVLARLHDLPLMPGVLSGLGLSVWLVYVADRLLDTYGVAPHALDLRHQFYLRWRQPLMFGAVPAAAGLLAWIALWVVPAGLMWQCLALGMLMVLYLAIYSASRARGVHLTLVNATSVAALILLNRMPLSPGFKLVVSALVVGLLLMVYYRKGGQSLRGAFPKEIAGGLLFALGCTAWSRFIAGGYGLLTEGAEVLLLASLFTSNLAAITLREEEAESSPAGARASRSEAPSYPPALTFSAVCVGAVFWWVHAGSLSDRLLPLAWAVAGGLVLLTLLHACRRWMSVDAYRVLADLAVLAPVATLI